MIKALVIEDEAVAARRLVKILAKHGVDVIQICGSNRELREYLGNNPEPELYFMDIHLSDGIVFEFLKEKKLDSPIIFTTAYDQYAIKAFKQNSIDYILKPIDEDELAQAIEKHKARLKSMSPSIDFQNLGRMILDASQQKTYKQRLTVKIGDRIRSIKIEEVAFFYSLNKTNLAFHNGRSYPFDMSLDHILEMLDPNKFFKVSRSHIVNINFIEELVSYSSTRLKVIINGAKDHEIIVSRERVKSLKSWLN